MMLRVQPEIRIVRSLLKQRIINLIAKRGERIGAALRIGLDAPIAAKLACIWKWIALSCQYEYDDTGFFWACLVCIKMATLLRIACKPMRLYTTVI